MTGAVPADGETGAVERSGEAFDLLLEQMRKLQSAFDAKIRYDEVRERFVQSMSDELAAHRENQAQLQLRPILVDLVTMHDDLTKIVDSSDSAPETVRVVGFFRDTVEQILARHGVEPFTVAEDTLDRGQQRAVSVVTTDDPSAHRRVAQRLRPGFRWHDKVLRPEWVTAYRYQPPAAERDRDAVETADPGPSAPPAPPEADEGAPR